MGLSGTGSTLRSAILKNRIIVLGASGFIGRRVVHALSQTDWAQPVAVSRRASAAIRTPGVDVRDLDVAEPGALREALAGATGVINCIAGPPESIVAISTELFAIAPHMTSPPRIVQLGSLAAYGSTCGAVDEAAPLRGDLDANSAAKAVTDRLASQCRSAVTLRPGIVYGPGSSWWSDRIARLLIRRRLGNLGSLGRGYCNLVYVDDVADAAVRALRLGDDQLGAFNLALSAPITWNDYFAQYAAALGALPLRLVTARRLALETHVLAPPLKVLERLLGMPRLARWNPLPPLRPWLPALCAHDIRMEVTRAEQILGMRWTPLSVGLRITAAWFRSGGRTA